LLEITPQGLSSARKIIRLLQAVVNAKPDLGAISKKQANSNHILNFETVKIKLRRMKFISNTLERKTYCIYNSHNPFLYLSINKLYYIAYRKNRRHFSNIAGPVRWHYLGIKYVLLIQGKGK
jgi:hypothetical protein